MYLCAKFEFNDSAAIAYKNDSDRRICYLYIISIYFYDIFNIYVANLYSCCIVFIIL